MHIMGYHDFNPIFGARHYIQVAGAVGVTEFVSCSLL